MNTTSRFQLFSIITKCIHLFLDLKVTNQIGFCRERTSAGKKENVALTRCINARRKKEEVQKKAEEETRRKVTMVTPMFDEGQSSKDVRTWRK
jgi:hypothetical protein